MMAASSCLGCIGVLLPIGSLNVDEEQELMDSSFITAISEAAGAVLSGVATTIAIVVAYKVHQNQKLLSQRQLLLPLWDYMATLSKIDSNNPIAPDVIRVVNTLELVALCCEGGMIDDKIIRRTFKDQFIMHYEDIKRCRSILGLTIDGESLLKQNKAATEFYNSLEIERLSQDRVQRA